MMTSLASSSGCGRREAKQVTMRSKRQKDTRWFTLGPRLTPHVRHRQKYIDVPVSDARAFVFVNRRARTLRQFTEALSDPRTVLDGYLRRNDFFRWIADVFGDFALADDLRRIEERYQSGWEFDVPGELINAIRSRYELSEDDVPQSALAA